MPGMEIKKSPGQGRPPGDNLEHYENELEPLASEAQAKQDKGNYDQRDGDSTKIGNGL